MDMLSQLPPMTVGCSLCGWAMDVLSADVARTALDAHPPRCPSRAEALAEAMKTVWLKGVPLRPSGEIDWLRYAQAIQSNLN